MKIRRASPADAARIVDIRCDAFQTVLSTYLDTTHVVNRLYSRIDLTSTILRNDRDTIVATDDDEEEIMGFCHLSVESPETRSTSWSLRHLEASLMGWQQWLMNLPTIVAYANKYRDRARKYEMFGATLRENKRLNTASLHEFVYIKILVVDPVHQGKRVGQALLNHCLDIARRNGIPAYLESSLVGYPFYQKAGFRDFGQAAVFKDETGKVITTLPVVLWTP